MKYLRLTKEQLEELHPEFVNFLATQSITSQEWDTIKAKQPEVAEQELDIFSDLIWEGALNKAKYLQNNTDKQLFLFKLNLTEMRLIAIKVSDTSVDLTTVEGLHWLQENLISEKIEITTGTKIYTDDKNNDIFQLIKQGAEITTGNLYEQLHERLA